MTVRLEEYDDVLRIRLSSIGSRAVGLDVSAYIVRGALIDTGFPLAQSAVVDAVRTRAVRGVIVTHWHEDHAGNAEALASLGLPVHLRADTEQLLRRPPRLRPYRRLTWGMPAAFTAPVAAFDALDADALRCVHTPGHSTDHQVVFDERTATLFSGDLWLGVRSRLMHRSEDPYEIIQSLRRAAALRPRRMFDAHRGLVTDATAALDARAVWLADTVGEVERRIVAGQPDRVIVRELLGREGWMVTLSGGEYAKRNLVRAVRRHVG